ncbi:MAG: hypothetical protein ACUVXI_16110 [bacterium]
MRERFFGSSGVVGVALVLLASLIAISSPEAQGQYPVPREQTVVVETDTNYTVFDKANPFIPGGTQWGSGWHQLANEWDWYINYATGETIYWRTTGWKYSPDHMQITWYTREGVKWFLDFPGRFIIAGHDGPGHIGICHKKPILRGMKLFHGKRGYGVSVEFNVKNGPITMLSITQTRDGRLKMISAQGESIPGPIFKIGNTNTRIRFGDMDVAEFGQAWAETGSSHHFALGIGHQLGKIEKLSKLLNLELVVINR